MSSGSGIVNGDNTYGDSQYVKLFDVNQSSDKYLNTFLTLRDTKRCMAAYVSDCKNYKLWKKETGKVSSLYQFVTT